MPDENNSTVAKPGSRLRELGLVLPKPPSPLGAYVEASQVGSLLFFKRYIAARQSAGNSLEKDECPKKSTIKKEPTMTQIKKVLYTAKTHSPSGLECEVAQALVDAADQTYPYSKAIRRNVDAVINLV